MAEGIVVSGGEAVGGANVLIIGHKCHRCSHKWVPERLDFSKIPKVCPKCKSPYWDTPKQDKKRPVVNKQKVQKNEVKK